MAQGADYLVKTTEGGETVYLFCTATHKFLDSKLNGVGRADLEAIYNARPKVDGAAILSEFPPPGPTKPDNTKDNTVNWQTYASRLQVGP